MAEPRILVTCRWPEEAERAVLARFDADIIGLTVDRRETGATPADWLGRYDYICPTITDRFDAAAIGSGGHRTRALCSFGAGVNHIDVAACRAAGIVVTNTPDVLTEDTADLAILLMLAAARRASEGERLVRARAWTGWTPTQLLGRSVSGRTLGLIGFGRIGRAMARKAHHGFGMRILYHDRHELAADALGFPAERRPFDEVLSTADVVALHVPGGPETRHIVDAARIALMRPHAVLVNTARGDLVDETALVAALRDRRIAAAGLDVFENEPDVRADLLALDNVVTLPHLGSATVESRTAMGLRALRNLEAIVAGLPAPDRVA